MVVLILGSVSLLALAFVGGYSLHVFPEHNDLFPQIKGFQARGWLSDGTAYSPSTLR